MTISQPEHLSTGIAAPRQDSIDLLEEQKQECVVGADFKNSSVIPRQDFDVEMEFGKKSFPVGEKRPLRSKQALQLGYTSTAGVVEVVGWGVQVDLKRINELPRLIGRRFMELFGKSQTCGLTELDEACLATICEQVDYRAFSLDREMPRYREATIVHRASGVFLKFLSEEVKLGRDLAAQLSVLSTNQRFGAWFTVNAEGDFTAINNLLILAPLEDRELDELIGEIPPVDESKVPDFIKEKLRRKPNGLDKSD